MTVTPLWVFTGDVRADIEFEHFEGSAQISESTLKANTGERGIRVPTTSPTGSDDVRVGKTLTPATELRLGYFLNHSGFDGTSTSLFRNLLGGFMDASGEETIFGIARQASTDRWHAFINGTNVAEVGTLASIGIPRQDRWYHIGFIVRIGAPGYAAMFVDQNLVWEYTSTITGEIGRVQFEFRRGSSSNRNVWDGSTIFDDGYLDDITGEPNTPPPPYRFPMRIVTEAGADAEWNSTEPQNHTAVSLNPHDGDGSYNYSNTDGERDTFNASDMDEFPGHAIIARHPYVIARRTNADGQIKLHTYEDSDYLSSAPLDLAIDYNLVMATLETMPDGTTPFTDEAAINATQIGYEADGMN